MPILQIDELGHSRPTSKERSDASTSQTIDVHSRSRRLCPQTNRTRRSRSYQLDSRPRWCCMAKGYLAGSGSDAPILKAQRQPILVPLPRLQSEASRGVEEDLSKILM